VTVALKLADGRQALAETMVFQPTIDIPSDVWISIALIFAVTAMFSIVAVRLAVQPVRMLARAADRLSRNIDEPPLAETRGAAEIRSAARSFNRMQDRLRRHVNSRALAFAAMSHDLRTPLTRMRLRLESLGGPAKAKLGADLDEIETLTQAALETIRGLALDEAMATLAPDAMARQLVADFRAMGHTLAVRGHASPLEARPQSLRRALVNVIDNAFKYAADVSLEIRDGAHEVTFEVADRGPGIPAEHLQRVLDPFYRVESSRNRGTGGSGLGLAIAKDIVEGHGGELVLANREGGGLSVTIRVPRAR
jgi:signal transduction histidine kinase